MGNINNLSGGNTFQVKKHLLNQQPDKPVAKMTMAELDAFEKEAKNDLKKIGEVKATFQDRYADNGKVEILVEGEGGVAVVSGRKISLPELGRSLPEYALELKAFDENGDNFIEEHELSTSWGEKLTSAGTAIGVGTLGGAGTGATIGAMGGTAVVPGIGTVAGGGALGLLGGAIGFIGSAVWEGGSTIMYAMGDGYNSPAHIR